MCRLDAFRSSGALIRSGWSCFHQIAAPFGHANSHLLCYPAVGCAIRKVLAPTVAAFLPGRNIL